MPDASSKSKRRNIGFDLELHKLLKIDAAKSNLTLEEFAARHLWPVVSGKLKRVPPALGGKPKGAKS